MNYISRYGLEYNPFLKDFTKLIETTEYKEVASRLNVLLNLKGFGLLCGSSGLGKTTCVHHFLESINQNAYKSYYISLSTVSVMEFYRNLSMSLGQEMAYRKVDNFRNIQSAINNLYLEKRIVPIIIIDEAQYLSNATFNDLKLLFNFDMDSANRAIILLVGLPTLNAILSQNVHEALRQRITMNYTINPLSLQEAKEYLLAKLKRAKANGEVFDLNAIETIVSYSGGIPRIIDRLCNQALMIGNSLNENIISADTVLKAIEDLALR